MPTPRGMMQNPRPLTIIRNGVHITGEQRTYLVCGGTTEWNLDDCGRFACPRDRHGSWGLNHEDAGFFDSRHEIETYVAKRNIKAAWGLKIPELALSLDQFATLLRCPTFILTFRNPVAILDSALVRGGDDFASALSWIDDYFQAMLRFAREATQPVVLVAYERAAAKPVQFIDELAAALNLAPTEDQKRDAKLCVTGDGGGYTHLPAQWHHVAVEPAPEAPCLLKLDEIQESFSDISVVAALEVSSRRETFFTLMFHLMSPTRSGGYSF